ncbi:7378_t:CDS:1, partial [Racocetra persica]
MSLEQQTAQNTTSQIQISQSEASQIQEQENIDYLQERFTNEFTHYEKESNFLKKIT